MIFNNLSIFIFLSCFYLKVHSTYIAGVYEHHFDNQWNDPQSVEKNLKKYNAVAYDAKKLGVDILLFPEGGLYGDTYIIDRKMLTNFSLYIPNPAQKISPCYSNNFSSVLKNLSCLAKQYEMYIVANINEKLDCNNVTQKELKDSRDCGKDKLYFFNTNVAFDRNGTVIARYRKHNLFGEFLFNTTLVPTISIFKTDFNVSFGLFTCFDILFDKPTLMLVKNYNLRHIIFPTRWYSELPFLTALQIQEGWSYVNNATLLASNINQPKVGSTGSGIFQGRTKNNVYYVTGKEESTLIISEVSKDNRYLPNPKYTYKIYPKIGAPVVYENKHPPINNNESISIQMVPYPMSNYSFKSVPLNKDKIYETVCQNNVCCQFNVSLNRNMTLMNYNSTYYKYQFVIRDGVRSFSGMADGGLQTCGIVACTTNDTNSCGLRFPDYNAINWPITFENIIIQANFHNQKNLIHFPNTVNASIMPIEASAWSWERKDNKTIIYKLNKPQNYILTFGIFGRNFNYDKPSKLMEESNDSNFGFAVNACGILLFGTLIFQYFYSDIIILDL